MTDNFNYALVKNEQGAYSIQSTVKSFNLDHVTHKDVTSFYRSFSQYASIDTGLLPLDGTGVLAIRSAGPHTQVVTQHAPGTYHLNWGAHEGDKHARTYYVAQPYRIVIGDFENGNLLGARMFYSPVPITSPGNQLYHVNLPNINCKGYRGNGVGWICLYHNDDWSALPFNEKVSRFIERCSGVETYNDANMSETDGPRFYASKSKPAYITDPSIWETKSTSEGYAWTLDPDLWIPVLVKDMDNQGSHDDNGQPLTLAMAMLGNYQAYYTDKNIPKMYNVISRPDLELTSDQVANFFKQSFATAPVVYSHLAKDDPYNFTISSRQDKGAEKLDLSKLFSTDEEDDDDTWTCASCEDDFDEQNYTTNDGSVCFNCLEDYYVFIESANSYYHRDNKHIFYSEAQDEFYHDIHDTVFICNECTCAYGVKNSNSDSQQQIKNYIHLDSAGEQICQDCLVETATSLELPLHSCSVCSKKIITDSQWSQFNPTIKTVIPVTNTDGTVDYDLAFKFMCNTCAPNFYVCPCGFIRDSFAETVNCAPTQIDSFDENISLEVNKCCASCTSEPFLDSDGSFTAVYSSFEPKALSVVVQKKIYQNINSITVQDKAQQLPF